MNDFYDHFRWVLMQDRASHTAASTIEYLKYYGLVLYVWPSNSYDLNSFENLWSILKMNIDELNPQSENELCHTLCKVVYARLWDSSTKPNSLKKWCTIIINL